MNKVWFNGKIDNMKVPEKELFSVIDEAIEKGKKHKKYKKRSRMTIFACSTSVALILISGFVFTPMTKVLAAVPLVGSIYESLHMNMGAEIEKKELITELNQTVSDNGIDITITSAYYDGSYIGVTFKAEGEGLSNSAVVDYSFYHYVKNGVKMGWSGFLGDLIEVDGYYESAIQIQYPEKELPKEYTLPLIFDNMGGVDGKWEFEIPVTQLPMKKVSMEVSTSKNEKFSFSLTSLVIGESNMRLHYSTTIPTDNLILKIIDDKGTELTKNTLLQYGDESAIFSTGIGDKTKYLLIYPIYRTKDETIELEPIKVKVLDR